MAMRSPDDHNLCVNWKQFKHRQKQLLPTKKDLNEAKRASSTFFSPRESLTLHLEHVGNAGGFDGDLAGFLHALFPPSAEQIGRVGLLVVGDGTRKSGFAHVGVFDQVVVPNLDGDGLRGVSAIEDELFVEARVEIVLDGFGSHRFTPAQSPLAFDDAVGISTTHRILEELDFIKLANQNEDLPSDEMK